MRRIVLIGILLVNALLLRAQELDASDSAEVQQKALRHVRQFEGLLNLVAQPDKYFRKYSFAKLIQSFYDEQSDYQIFRDSLVAVEDNLNPNADPGAENLLTVKDYLKAFFSFYEKSPVASVFFSNYEVSPVRQGDFTYVEVYYTSEFTNRHRAYPDQPYPLRYQKATLRAERQADGWAVLISDISYGSPGDASPGDEPSVSPPTDDQLTASRNDDPVENLSDALADSSRTWQVLDKIDRGSDYRLSIYDSVAVLKKPSASLPRVSNPSAVEGGGASADKPGAFKNFVPLIRRAGKSSVQVIFDNPVDDSLTVELMSLAGQVLYSEKVGGRQHYVQSINLKNLGEGTYQISVSNDDYRRAERIRYRAVSTDDTAPEEEERETKDFKPYVTQESRESVQVILYNPTDDPLSVELTDVRGEILYSEKVASKDRYAKSINLKNLNQGSYRLRILNADYNHTVRVYH